MYAKMLAWEELISSDLFTFALGNILGSWKFKTTG